jgi:arsenate reductase (thioredoxin)
MAPKELLILCTGEFSYGHILSGYLTFYAGNQINITIVATENHHLHPLAIQVMKEDGIDISGYKSTDVSILNNRRFSLIASLLDDPKWQSLWSDIPFIQMNFTTPDQSTSYEEVLELYREMRETIKTAAIELVGEYAFPSSQVDNRQNVS